MLIYHEIFRSDFFLESMVYIQNLHIDLRTFPNQPLPYIRQWHIIK